VDDLQFVARFALRKRALPIFVRNPANDTRQGKEQRKIFLSPIIKITGYGIF
jgi:hypothetical protein